MFWETYSKLCTLHKTTPTAVAVAIGLSNAITTKWKNGALPKSDILLRLADYFKCSVDYLLTGKEVEVATGNNELTENEREWLQILQNFSERDQIRLIDRVQRDVVPELSSEIKEKTSDYKKAN